MASKYLRELAMHALNDFWRQHVADLRPTAGYPVDALRFEMEAFADAVAGRAAYPVSPEQIVMTAATLEAAIQAVEAGGVVTLDSLA